LQCPIGSSIAKSVTPEGEKNPFPQQIHSRNSYSPVSASLQTKSQNWDCELCTFSNKANIQICEICGQSKVTPVILLEESTECPRCTYLNENGALKCTVCHASLSLESSNDHSQGHTSSNADSLLNSSTDVKTPPFYQCTTLADGNKMTTSQSLADKSMVIELDDDSDDDIVQGPRQSKRQRLDDSPGPQNKPFDSPASNKNAKLSFSVSMNSGRVAIHDGISESMFPVNFDLETVLDNQTSEQILARQLKRGNVPTICASNVTFNENEVLKGTFLHEPYHFISLNSKTHHFTNQRPPKLHKNFTDMLL
jgi:hypothetical protein